jgi:hypothetical protein
MSLVEWTEELNRPPLQAKPRKSMLLFGLEGVGKVSEYSTEWCGTNRLRAGIGEIAEFLLV